MLEPWEEHDIVRPLFGWKRRDGTRRYREAYIEIPKKNGKLLDLETPIPTPWGWTTMGALRVGDQVFDLDGQPTPIVAVSEVEYPITYRVRFSDDTEILAGAEHQWYTEAYVTGLRRGPRRRTWMEHLRTTEQIAKTLTVPSFTRRGLICWNHRIPLAEPLDCAERDLPIEPYTLGAWLGDGDSRGGVVTQRGIEDAATMMARIRSEGGEVWPVVGGRFRVAHLTTRLREMGLIRAKSIPPKYLRASKSQRFALVAGLMDTDGFCSPAGQCEFSTTTPALRDGMLELLRSLGFKPTVKTGRARYAGRDYGESYRIQFWPYAGAPIFTLARKADRLKAQPTRRTRALARQIIGADVVPTVPMKCIQVANPLGLYLVGEGMVPTHNSTLAAGLALFLLLADGEMGAEVYGAAGDKDQARIVFNDAKLMRAASPELRKRSRAFKDSIVAHATASFYRVLSSDAPTKHGLNSHAVVFDELHVQPDRELWDTMYGGGAARRQPLTLSLTTAGHDRRSICWEKHDYALKVLDGSIVDTAFLAVIYAAAETDDWRSEAIWAKANPNLDVSVKGDFLRDLAKKAEESLAFLNTFKRLHLNIWTESITRWLPPERWRACGGSVDVAALAGRRCFGGLDLSTTTDITAFELLFPPEAPEDLWILLSHFWCPEAAVGLRARRDRVPYDVWVQQRALKATAGDVVDYDVVRADIRQLATTYRIQEIAYDRWNASQLVTQLQEDGALMVPFGQGFASMSAPTKDLEKLVVGEKLRHGDHPVLGWMAANVVIAQDAADNWKPTKAKSTGRIDGIVATIMALGRAMTPPPHSEPRISVLG